MSDSIYAAGVYNGYLTSAPSHRARIPATSAFSAPAAATTDCALDVRAATYYRRTAVDPSPPGECTVNTTGTCSNADGRVWVEQRWYAHRTIPSLLVMEVEVLTQDSDDVDAVPQAVGVGVSGLYVQAVFNNHPGAGSADLNLLAVPVPAGAPYTVVNGSTYVAESNTSSLQAVAVLTGVTAGALPQGGQWVVQFAQPATTVAHVSGRGGGEEGGRATAPAQAWPSQVTVIRTSVETDPPQLPQAVVAGGLSQGTLSESPHAPSHAVCIVADFGVALQLAGNGTLHSTHVAEWASTVWASGYATDRHDVAQAVNTSLYAIAS